MLNIAQTRTSVKSALANTLPAINTRNLAGQNEAYKTLKAIGWTSALEMHPTDRVPVFRMDAASIRRDKRNGGWIVEIDGDEFEADGDLGEITAHVKNLLAARPALVPTGQGTYLVSEPAPKLSDAAKIGAELIRQHGQLGGRIQRAVELVEAGKTEFPHYNTRVDPATGISQCDCPDRGSTWIDSGNRLGILTMFNGRGCKHCLAQHIAYRLRHEAEATAYRKHFDRVEMRRARETALPASVDSGSILDMLDYSSVEDQIAAARSQVPGLNDWQHNRQFSTPNATSARWNGVR